MGMMGMGGEVMMGEFEVGLSIVIIIEIPFDFVLNCLSMLTGMHQ